MVEEQRQHQTGFAGSITVSPALLLLGEFGLLLDVENVVPQDQQPEQTLSVGSCYRLVGDASGQMWGEDNEPCVGWE